MSSPPTPGPQAQRRNYPGLYPPEVPILRRWLEIHEAEYDRFEYNVRVGKGSDPGPTQPEEIRRMAIMNSQLRIDLIAWKGTQATLVEVKRRAKGAALGQILAYADLWQASNPGLPAPKLVVVTDSPQPDMPGVLQRAGVGLDVVGS